MLCRKFRHTLFVKSTLNNNVQYCLLKPRLFSKRCILDGVFATVSKSEGIRMSSIRFVLKDLSIARLWSAWSRSFIVNNVVRRVKRDRCVREVFDRFRQTIFRPRRTFLLAATAAFKGKGDDSSETPPSCQQNITDDDLEALLTELEGVEKLSQATLFCTSCGKRLVIDKKQPGVRYCACKESQALEDSSDGWVPYMEAEDVIIWRKEYKPGQGLYAYKVYGRYKEVQAADFAAVQVDGAYRRAWDAAVAALALVERRANGVSDQAVLHWEVLWPRLFANRDYVYIRRHKEFTINSPPLPHKDGIFTPSEPQTPPERPNVHSRAKQKSRDNERREMDGGVKENKVFIIVSRSCEHPKVPETKHAIRVLEYWSHMVVKTIDGPDKPGMEFVLTYYDEPAVGGLPTGVATWATGRAAPAYLERMRRAAAGYQAWSDARGDQDLPDFAPFGPPKPQDVCLAPVTVSEQDMESSKDGPDLDSGNGSETTRDQSTQTDDAPDGPTRDVLIKMTAHAKNDVKNQPEVQTKVENMTKKEEQQTPQEGDSDTPEEEESNNNGSWWRYLYPFYYFV